MNSTRIDPILSLSSSSRPTWGSNPLSFDRNSVFHEDHCDDSKSLDDDNNHDDDGEQSGDDETEEEGERKEEEFDDEQSHEDEEGFEQDKDDDDSMSKVDSTSSSLLSSSSSSDDDDFSSSSNVPSPIIIKMTSSSQQLNHHDEDDNDHDSTSSIATDYKDYCDQDTNNTSVITQQDLNNLYSILYWEFHPNVQPSSNQESLFQWVTCLLSKYSTDSSIEMIKSSVLRMLIDHKFCNDDDDAMKIVDQLGKCFEDDSDDGNNDDRINDNDDVDRGISNTNSSSSIPIKKRKVSNSWPFIPSESSASSTISSLSVSSSPSSSSLKKSKAERYHDNYSDGKDNKNLPHQNNHGVSFKTKKIHF